MEDLANTQILIPYSTSPAADPVTVDGFVWVTIIQAQIQLGNGPNGDVIAAVDLTRLVPEACQ
jgi:hypothetical protein